MCRCWTLSLSRPFPERVRPILVVLRDSCKEVAVMGTSSSVKRRMGVAGSLDGELDLAWCWAENGRPQSSAAGPTEFPVGVSRCHHQHAHSQRVPCIQKRPRALGPRALPFGWVSRARGSTGGIQGELLQGGQKGQARAPSCSLSQAGPLPPPFSTAPQWPPWNSSPFSLLSPLRSPFSGSSLSHLSRGKAEEG